MQNASLYLPYPGPGVRMERSDPRAGPVRVVCGSFQQGVQQSVRGVRRGHRIDFSISDFSESPRGLSSPPKFPKGLFISIHFPRNQFLRPTGVLALTGSTGALGFAAETAKLFLTGVVVCRCIHVPWTAGDRVALFVDTRRREIVLFKRLIRKELQLCFAE